MPPKKKADGATNGDTGDGGRFSWTTEKDRKLLILTQGRYLSSDDYAKLLEVFPGTTLNGVRIRVSRFRVEQRDLCEKLGWTLPEGGAAYKVQKGKKRGGKTDETAHGDDSEKPTPSPKKARTSKKAAIKAEEIAENDVSGNDLGIKAETIEDEF